MTKNYEPNIEDDDGYSIPKIVGAILFLVLVGAGVYIYFQQKKLKTSVSYLLDSKKQAEQDLNQMIERYNLAIDDNSSLESDLKEERDFIIKYRDSIRNIESEDFEEITVFKKQVLKLKQISAIQFDNASASSIDNTTIPEIVEADNPNKNSSVPKSKTKQENAISPVKNSTVNLSVPENLDNNTTNLKKEEFPNSSAISPAEEVSDSEKEGSTEIVNKETPTSFNYVEVPPTYPGCEGTSNEKKICFAKKVKKHLARKFNVSIVDNLNIKSGEQRMWVHFNVDTNGNISNIVARGPHKKLEEEALRVVKTLPKMTAAKQNGKSVQMNYSVPITVKVP